MLHTFSLRYCIRIQVVDEIAIDVSDLSIPRYISNVEDLTEIFVRSGDRWALRERRYRTDRRHRR